MGGNGMVESKFYFSEFFGISHSVLDEYGAFDISLLADIPVFIDPFRLYASKKEEYQNLHKRIVRYLRFLKDASQRPVMMLPGNLREFYAFPEVSNTYIGFCVKGSSGRGLGMHFAMALKNNLESILNSFDQDGITDTSHLEKLCIICEGVGVDCISDFTTNLIKDYLLDFTEKFAKTSLPKGKCQTFGVRHAQFDFGKNVWQSGTYYLPDWNNKPVILVPKDLLTKDDTWINRKDLIRQLTTIPETVGDEVLKSKLIALLANILDEDRKLSLDEKKRRVFTFCQENPQAIDWYIKGKEEHKGDAILDADERLLCAQGLFYDTVSEFRRELNSKGFYEKPMTSLEEVLHRIYFFKHEIEHNDGYKIFYHKGQKHITETNVQTAFRFVWIDTKFDLNREVNNGRGSADFVVSFGSGDKCVIEFKLASNKQLEHNLQNQLEIYKEANRTNCGVCVIVFTSDAEYKRMKGVLTRLGLDGNPRIIAINAIPKISASKVQGSGE